MDIFKLINKPLMSLICFSFFLPTFAVAQKLTYNIQSTVTTGTNNGSKETYTGIWLNAKTNIGLDRHSLLSLKAKLGGKSFTDNTSPNTNDFDLQATYLYQPSSGFDAPLYSASLAHKNESYKGSSKDSKRTSLTFFRSQPFGNKLKLALGYKIENENGKSDIDSKHLIFNADYSYNIDTLFYFNIRLADEKQNYVSSTASSGNNTSARPVDTSGGHLPGEGGHSVSTTTSGNNVFNSSNSSLSVGTIYTLNQNHSFDIALITHFYNVTNEANSTTTNSSSNFLAFDYFYHF